MYTPSTFHMKVSYVIKSQSHNTDTQKYMETLSGENADEYFKAMGDEIQGIMKRGTWEIFNGSQFLIKMCFQECGLSNARENLIGKSEKLKARCFVRGDVQKRLSTEPLNSYYPVVLWTIARLMLIL